MLDFANAKQPMLPRHPTNPVGQTRRVKKVQQAVRRDIEQAQKMTLNTLQSWPTQVQNGRLLTNAFYEFLIDLSAITNLVSEIGKILSRGGGPQETRRAAESAYREGTSKAVENLAGILDDYTRTPTQRLGDQQVLRRAAMAGARSFEMMEGFAGDTANDLGRVLFRAVQDGENPRETAKTIRERFRVSKARADRIARTEVTGALRRGRWDEARDAQEKFGRDIRLVHYSALIAGRTRRSHARRHGKIVTVEEQTQWYAQDANAINCFLPGTRVRGTFVAGSKARYKGAAVRLVTADGDVLAVTPNHPVLTDRGIVPAGDIREGDHLVRYGAGVKGALGVGSLHGEMPDATVEQVFGALMDLGHSFARRVRPVDFHGDAGRMDKDIDVVNADGPLVVGDDVTCIKFRDDLGFAFADLAHPRFSAQPLGVEAIDRTPASFVRGLCVDFAPLGGKLGVAEELGIAGVSDAQPEAREASVYSGPTDTVFVGQGENGSSGDMLGVKAGPVNPCVERAVLDRLAAYGFEPFRHGAFGDVAFIGETLDRFAGSASESEVVKVERFKFSGHVYDLQDVTGLMIADNIALRNCLCTQTEIVLNKDGEPLFGKKMLERMKKQREAFVATAPEAGSV